MNVFVVVAVQDMEYYWNMKNGIVGIGGIGDGNFAVRGGFGAQFLLGILVEVGIVARVLLFQLIEDLLESARFNGWVEFWRRYGLLLVSTVLGSSRMCVALSYKKGIYTDKQKKQRCSFGCSCDFFIDRETINCH